jgi:hypothetical protein
MWSHPKLFSIFLLHPGHCFVVSAMSRLLAASSLFFNFLSVLVGVNTHIQHTYLVNMTLPIIILTTRLPLVPRHIVLDAVSCPASPAAELWLVRVVYLSKPTFLVDAPAPVGSGFAYGSEVESFVPVTVLNRCVLL